MMKSLRIFLLLSCMVAGAMAYAEPDDWALTGFRRLDGVNPIVSPNPQSCFWCPLTRDSVAWECNDTFNPAATVYEGQVALLYRAEDAYGVGIGGRTSRLGFALSDDGLHFKRNGEPCFFPADDDQQRHEWPGGCEDPRVVQTEDGLYVMLYTQWNHRQARLGVATTRDFVHWQKHGSPFAKCYDGKFTRYFSKSASIVTQVVEGRQIAVKVNGHYLMYWGEQFMNIATSDNLIDWTPMLGDDGDLLHVVDTRPGKFDSSLTECGPPAILTDKGIIVIYNGKNATDGHGDNRFTPGAYCAGQVMFSLEDPTKEIARLDEPFFVPEADFEKSGQYPAGTVFVEGLVFFQDKWFLYYGCADSRVGVAVLDPRQQAMDKVFRPLTFQATNGVILPYRRLDPQQLEHGKKYPLVIFLHGAGERGYDNSAQLVHGGSMWLNPSNRENYPCYVIAPQCPPDCFWAYDSWTPSFMPWLMPQHPEAPAAYQALMELIDAAVELPQVDRHRIYVMGLSMGGMCTYDLCCRRPELFAAAVPMCGTIYPERLKGINDIAFSIYHGDADTTVPVEGSREAYKVLCENGVKVRLREFPGCGHGCWNPAFCEPDFMSWLFSQSRKKGR